MSDSTVALTPLSAKEKQRKKDLEDRVELGIQGMERAIDALEEIQREGLFRDEYPTFEEYLKAKWTQSDRYFRRFRKFFEVRASLKNNGVPAGELKEGGSRELSTNTTAEEQVDIAKTVTNEGKPLTAANIRQEKEKRAKAKAGKQGQSDKIDDKPADRSAVQSQPLAQGSARTEANPGLPPAGKEGWWNDVEPDELTENQHHDLRETIEHGFQKWLASWGPHSRYALAHVMKTYRTKLVTGAQCDLIENTLLVS
jgi:hypothetical protein